MDPRFIKDSIDIEELTDLEKKRVALKVAPEETKYTEMTISEKHFMLSTKDLDTCWIPVYRGEEHLGYLKIDDLKNKEAEL